MPAAVTNATIADPANARNRSTRPTGSCTGRPLTVMKVPDPPGRSCRGSSAKKPPKRTPSVAAAKAANTALWNPSVLQNTSP